MLNVKILLLVVKIVLTADSVFTGRYARTLNLGLGEGVVDGHDIYGEDITLDDSGSNHASYGLEDVSSTREILHIILLVIIIMEQQETLHLDKLRARALQLLCTQILFQQCC